MLMELEKQLLLRLRILLQSNYLYYFLLVLSLSISLIYVYFFKHESEYKLEDKFIIGVITDLNYNEEKYKIEIKGKEKLIAYYLSKEDLKLRLGMKIKLNGNLYLPNNNTIPNTFNYKKYLNNHQIYYLMKVQNLEVLKDRPSFIYKIKNYLDQRINSFSYTNNYLKALILGDLKELDDDTYKGYQINGVIHLFAISGMHINLLAVSLILFLKKIKIKEVFKYLLVILFLIIFCLVINTSASVYRSLIFFILLTINKLGELEISTKNILFLTVVLLMIANPPIIFDVGFQYSAVTTYGLIISTRKKKSNYLLSLLYTSFIAFLFSMPITLINFYEISLLSPINNLIFGPLITFIVYPLSLITIIFSFFEPLFYFILKFMEIINSFLSNLNVFNLIIPKVNIIFYLLYYILIILYIYSIDRRYFILACLLILSFKLKPILDNNTYVYFLDVGQGDSALIYNQKESILIDTGGLYNFNISDTTLIFLKSLGLIKLDLMLLTHGDYDHMGEAINLVENFKVEKVILNCGEFNELEQELIKVLDKKKIKYYSCIKELNVDKNKLYFLQTKEYDNENDNSNVIYTEINGYKFMFMGDAGVEVEEDLIEKYNLKDIDVLKVGHHGSKTSSSKKFINQINPKYSIISVGKNNRYGHPNDSVLDNLEDSKIYRTDQDGSIMFRIKSDNLEIKTCIP